MIRTWPAIYDISNIKCSESTCPDLRSCEDRMLKVQTFRTLVLSVPRCPSRRRVHLRCWNRPSSQCGYWSSKEPNHYRSTMSKPVPMRRKPISLLVSSQPNAQTPTMELLVARSLFRQITQLLTLAWSPKKLFSRNSLSFRSTSSTGCDVITNRLLRNTAQHVEPSLTYLYYLSIEHSEFPLVWKKVIPIFKRKGQPNDPSNYRPISLLPAVGKLLDGIQSSRLLSYLTTNRLISDHQFGFIPGRSTTHQLLYIVHQWAKALDDGNRGWQPFSWTFFLPVYILQGWPWPDS